MRQALLIMLLVVVVACASSYPCPPTPAPEVIRVEVPVSVAPPAPVIPDRPAIPPELTDPATPGATWVATAAETIRQLSVALDQALAELAAIRGSAPAAAEAFPDE